jgi:hypothetical protein
MLGNDCEPLALLSPEPRAQRLPSCFCPRGGRHRRARSASHIVEPGHIADGHIAASIRALRKRRCWSSVLSGPDGRRRGAYALCRRSRSASRARWSSIPSVLPATILMPRCARQQECPQIHKLDTSATPIGGKEGQRGRDGVIPGPREGRASKRSARCVSRRSCATGGAPRRWRGLTGPRQSAPGRCARGR